jgi:putative nucleotidyltransferase with HDIG domain
MDATIDTASPVRPNPISKPNLSIVARERSFGLLQNMMQIIALKDQGTLKHSNRVQALTHEWASYMRRRWQWLEMDLEALEMAALLHDVGKVGVLDEVLLKKGSLTPAERDHMEQHSEIGYQMIRDFPGIHDITLGIRHHHERWDGKGYPLGLKEKQIPVFAQIIAIVDAFDAMTSDRPYRKALPELQALQEIEKEAGRQFGPEFAASFVQFMRARNT